MLPRDAASRRTVALVVLVLAAVFLWQVLTWDAVPLQQV
jgi:hypothetical protein